MRIATCQLESVTRLQQRRPLSKVEFPMKNQEKDDAYEKRSWIETAHWTPEGKMFIPAMAFKKSVETAAKRNPRKYSGQRTYTKHFLSGMMVMDDLVLDITREDIIPCWLYLPSQPGRATGGRVWKCMPTVHHWSGTAKFVISEDIITPDIFELYLAEAGMQVGVGVWRPENGGLNGRYLCNEISWEENVDIDKFKNILVEASSIDRLQEQSMQSA